MIGTASRVLALCVSGSLATAQAPCSEVLLNELFDGTSTIRLRTPDGAPVVGGPFSLRVEGAEPTMIGALVYSASDTPFFDPAYGATFWFGPPFGVIEFSTDASGRSADLLPIDPVDPFLCGEFAVFQAGVFDPLATGGVAISNAIRLRIGEVTEPVFRPVLDPTTGLNYDVEFGDADGDGLRDLLLGRGRIAVGLPGGGFAAPVTIAGMNPLGTRAPRLGDLDADGHVDQLESVSIARVRAFLMDGSLGVLQTVETSVFGSGELGDFDLDGVLDLLVVPSLTADTVGWMRGTGTGSFEPAVASGSGFADCSGRSAIGDLNQDGDLDWAIGASVGTITGLGNGDGTFSPVGVAHVPADQRRLTIVDIDGNGELDLLGVGGNTMSVLPGNGDGTFQPWLGWSSPRTLGDLKLADLDGDGLCEAVSIASDATMDVVYVRENLGGGLFGPTLEYGGPRNPGAVGVTDVDLDGALDVVAVGGGYSLEYESGGPFLGPGNLLTLRGLGDGTLESARVETVASNPFTILTADLDGDGRDEVLTLSRPSGAPAEVVVFSTDGEGAHHAATHLVQSGGRALDIGDFDGDQLVDLVVGNDAGDLAVFPGDGAGGFGPAITTASGVPVEGIGAGDFDEDGLLDVVVTDWGPTQALALLPGNGDGTFGVPSVLSTTVRGHTVQVADFDGDSHLDFAVATVINGVPIFLGNGDGTFSTSSAAGYPFSLADVADIDGDGNLDVFVHSIDYPVTGSLGVALGAGDGTFQPLLAFQLSQFSQTLTDTIFQWCIGPAVALGDFDGDGVVDCAVSEAGKDSVLHVLSGNGDGTFTPLLTTRTGFSPQVARAVDLDGDGIQDLVITDHQATDCNSSRPGRVRFHLNRLGE